MNSPRLPGIAAEAFSCPILVIGAPRSGTTWLAKIIDSHPDVLYRHEPDETIAGPSPLTDSQLPGLLRSWFGDRSPRTVTKRPFFRKSWQAFGARSMRTLIAGVASAATRLPRPFDRLAQMQISDLASRDVRRVAIKSVRWADGAAVLARILPDSRTIFILRHPCGQVGSVMRGHRQKRFELKEAGTMPYNEVASMSFAAAHGVDAESFQILPDAAKYAWGWRSFNEPAYEALASRQNVLVVIYEALCAQPEALSRDILAFCGLAWDAQTADFVARSSVHQGPAGYYAVYRNAVAAAESWRRAMPRAEQDAIRSVVAASPLAKFWPDLLQTV